MKKVLVFFLSLVLVACSKTSPENALSDEELRLESSLQKFIPTAGITRSEDQDQVKGLEAEYPQKDLDFYQTRKGNILAVEDGKLIYYSKDKKENNKTELYQKGLSPEEIVDGLKDEGLLDKSYFIKEEAPLENGDMIYLLMKDLGHEIHNYGDYIALSIDPKKDELVKLYVEDRLVLEKDELDPAFSKEEALDLAEEKFPGKNPIIRLVVQDKDMVDFLKEADANIGNDSYIFAYEISDGEKILYLDAMDGKVLYYK